MNTNELINSKIVDRLKGAVRLKSAVSHQRPAAHNA